MKEFLRQRSDAWELRVYLGRDPGTDKQRYATRTVRAGKRAVQRALATMVTEAERGLVVRATSTVGELLEAWFDQAAVRDISQRRQGDAGFRDRNVLLDRRRKNVGQIWHARTGSVRRLGVVEVATALFVRRETRRLRAAHTARRFTVYGCSVTRPASSRISRRAMTWV